MSEGVIDVEHHEVAEGTQALERYEAKTPATLFGTDDPVAVIQRAAVVAAALSDIIDKQRLFSNISGKKHVKVEGWTLLGSMLGLFPVVEYCKPVEIDGVKGFEAKVNAKTRDDEIVGSAISYCMRNEQRWSKADSYAVASMAQTRATSKSLRGPLGFVVTMAGYDATPMEEIVDRSEERHAAPAPAPQPKQFDPVTALRPDAVKTGAGWKGIWKKFDDVEPSIQWPPVVEQAIKGLFGETFNLKEAEQKQKDEAFFRTSNAAGRLTELFTEETFVTHDSIRKAFAEMFNGIVVTVDEFENPEPAPLSQKKEGE